jgi:hypothetical protein
MAKVGVPRTRIWCDGCTKKIFFGTFVWGAVVVWCHCVWLYMEQSQAMSTAVVTDPKYAYAQADAEQPWEQHELSAIQTLSILLPNAHKPLHFSSASTPPPPDDPLSEFDDADHVYVKKSMEMEYEEEMKKEYTPTHSQVLSDGFTYDSNDPMFMSVHEAVGELQLPGMAGIRPPLVNSSYAAEYWRRTMRYLQPLINPVHWSIVASRADREYRDFEASRRTDRNKHREFYTRKISPLVEQFGPLFQRVALVGSLNGLIPEVTRQFYALLLLISRLPEEEAEPLVRACMMVAGMGECDPYMYQFPL